MSEFTQSQIETQRAFMEACKPAPIPAVEDTGIILGVPAHEYHRRELHVASKSALDELTEDLDGTPAHYKAWLHGEQREPTSEQRFGNTFHVALLEPTRFRESVIIRPEFSGKGSVAARDKWEAENAGRIIITAEDEAQIAAMLGSIMRHPAASRLVAEGQSEVTLRWIDPATGLRCKSRADYWVKHRRLAVDVKTTKCANKKKFSKDVYNYRYHVQDAMYRAGFAECGEPISHFAVLAVEKEPPYAVAVYTLDASAVEKGYNAMRRDMETLATCVETGKWPAYSDVVEELSLPGWAA